MKEGFDALEDPVVEGQMWVLRLSAGQTRDIVRNAEAWGVPPHDYLRKVVRDRLESDKHLIPDAVEAGV